MAVVTDKDIYLDNSMIDLMNVCIERVSKGWDNVIIMDGKERAGKSTFAKSMAYYYAWKKNIPFSLDNVFFDPEKMLHFAKNNKESVIIWDEAAFGGLGSQWQSKVQQMLKSMLMVTGKYKHTYIFIIPSFFTLARYLALHRSIGLVHVYSPDLITRGYFVCYNETEKVWIYNNNRKSELYPRNCAFRGKFTKKNTDLILDNEGYELMKDEAISTYLSKETHKVNKTDELSKLKYTLSKIAFEDKVPFNTVELGKLLSVSDQTIRNWYHILGGCQESAQPSTQINSLKGAGGCANGEYEEETTFN